MKILSLNIWEGKVLKPLKEFILNHSQEVDIFCFQEVLRQDQFNLYDQIQEVLPEFNGYFTEQIDGVGIATFVRKTIKVEKSCSFLILSAQEVNHLKMANGSSYYPRMLQAVSIKEPELTILNFHGVPGNLKQDTKERELQTKRLEEAINNFNNPRILVGDFNLNPDTKAITELEKYFVNPIKSSSYKTTRSKFYDKGEIMPFADYIFVSPDIKIKKFFVLPDEVSDHLPVLLEFEI